MTSIWTGDITRPSDIIKLEAILENLHTYAVNELRPWISSYIEQWLEIFPMDSSPPRTISEEPFSHLRSAQNSQPGAEKAADPQTPQSNPPQSAESQSASKTDILHMLQAEHRRLLGDVADLLRENQSTPGRDTPSQGSFASPSPSARPKPSSSGPNMPPESLSRRHSDSSRPSSQSFQQDAPPTPTPASTRSLPGNKGRRPIPRVRLPPTGASGAASDKKHHDLDSSSTPSRSTQTPAPDVNDNDSKGVGESPAIAQRSERTNLGPSSAKSSASHFDFGSYSSNYDFGFKSPDFKTPSISAVGGAVSSPNSGFRSHAPTWGFGPKAFTVPFDSSTPAGFFDTSTSIGLFGGTATSNPGLSSKTAKPQSSSSPSVVSVGANHGEDLDYDTSESVPPRLPGGHDRQGSRRVKSDDGPFSNARGVRKSKAIPIRRYSSPDSEDEN
jgi:hypothetical protein